MYAVKSSVSRAFKEKKGKLTEPYKSRTIEKRKNSILYTCTTAIACNIGLQADF